MPWWYICHYHILILKPGCFYNLCILCIFLNALWITYLPWQDLKVNEKNPKKHQTIIISHSFWEFQRTVPLKNFQLPWGKNYESFHFPFGGNGERRQVPMGQKLTGSEAQGWSISSPPLMECKRKLTLLYSLLMNTWPHLKVQDVIPFWCHV